MLGCAMSVEERRRKGWKWWGQNKK
jgi:hypothetical protein